MEVAGPKSEEQNREMGLGHLGTGCAGSGREGWVGDLGTGCPGSGREKSLLLRQKD